MTKSLSKAIALATLVGATASAQAAISVNPDGLGEVLLYSLYSVEEGNITNINITNTTNVGKAVKVRFVEGQNSQEVLDFNLYLSPRDQWSGAVTATEDGAKLITADKSCTAPVITSAGVDFKSLDYIDDGGEQSLARTRVGHLEVIEMGTLEGAVAAGVTTPHSPGAAPVNCGIIAKNFAKDGVWHAGTTGYDINKDVKVGADVGGLYGTAEIMNVDESTVISYDAVAIDGFLSADKPLHAQTGSIYPNLNGNVLPPVAGSVVSKEALANKEALVDGVIYTFPTTIQAISAVLAKSEIHNNYVIDEGRASKSNWVITYPTKRFHVDMDMDNGLAAIAANEYAGLEKAEKEKAGTLNEYVSARIAPFTQPWSVREGESCETLALSAWDSEEYIKSDLKFSPSRPDVDATLCYETNILTFNGGKLLGGEFVTRNIDLDAADFPYGWMNVDYRNYKSFGASSAIGTENAVVGLPVIGFSAANFRNNEARPGINNIYTSSSNHKGSKATTTVTNP